MIAEAVSPVATAACSGLAASPKTLPPWLFYDEPGSQLFEQITQLPEYYLTRTERSLFARHANDILTHLASPVTVLELGAGTATKTGILLQAAARLQPSVLYQPIDVSPSALEDARENLQASIPEVTVQPQVANYITEAIRVERARETKVLALYIGSSIGNFAPQEASAILRKLRAQLEPGDALLLGADLAPGPNKSVAQLLAAYDDAAGVTAAFDRNILARLNRELGANFDLAGFTHQARWNPAESRIEMHLVSGSRQTVTIAETVTGAPLDIHFAEDETIHTENSYKFTPERLAALLASADFAVAQTFTDPAELFAVTLAAAVES